MYLSGINQKNPGRLGYKKMTGRYCGRGKERFWEIDFLRGLCVSLMIIDHLMFCLYDILPFLNDMFGTNILAGAEAVGRWYWTWDLRILVRQVVITMFFMLCGVSCTLTRGNFRRGILLAIVAAGITAVTYVVENNFGLSNATVLFGVIHMIAAGVFLYAFTDNAAIAAGDVLGQGKAARIAREVLRFLPALAGIGLLVWYFTQCSYVTYTGGIWQIHETVPARGSTEENLFLSIFVYVDGFNFSRYSGDYFPVLPFAALILVGGAIGRLVYHSSAKYALSPLDGAWNSGVCFIGRHAAFVYVAHMVVIPVALFLTAWIASLF